MKVKYLLILFLLAYVNVYSQVAGFNYIPLEFKELQPQWTHVSYDSTIVNLEIEGSTATYDGYSHVHNSAPSYVPPAELLINEGFLYRVSPTLYDYDLAGALIEKIDIATGKLMWQKTFDPRDSGIKEYVFRYIIVRDKLVLYNLEITSPGDVFLGFTSGYLKIREYALDDGRLLYESFPDPSEANMKELPVAGDNRAMMMISEDGNTVEVKTLNTDSLHGRILVIDSLDRSGKLLNDSDTLVADLDIDWEFRSAELTFKFMTLPKDSLVWLIHHRDISGQGDPAYAQLNFYHKNELSRSVEIDIETFPDLITLCMLAVTPELIICDALFLNERSGFIEIDRKTGVINEIIRYQHTNFPACYQKLEVYDGNKFLFDDLRYYGSSLGTEIYEREGNKLILKKTYFLLDDKSGAYINDIYQLPDGDYIINLVYSKTRNGLFQGRHTASIRLTPEQLGYETSATTDYNTEHNATKLYPNPCVDFLNVNIEDNCHQVTIIDLNGQTIYSADNINSSLYQVDVSQLMSGAYYLNISYDNRMESVRFVKID